MANPRGNWMNVVVDGSVSGDVDFVGLEKMTIGGNYTFNDGSQITAAILPYAVSGAAINETDINLENEFKIVSSRVSNVLNFSVYERR